MMRLRNFMIAAGISRPVSLLLLGGLLLVSAACGRSGSTTANADNPNEKPAKSGMKHRHGPAITGTRSLDVYGDGQNLHLLVGDYTTDGGKIPTLNYRHSKDGGETWSEPAAIPTGGNPPEEPFRGVDAQIAAYGDKIVAVWTGGGGNSKHGKGSMGAALSTDGGKTWQVGPEDLGSKEGSTFIDLSANQGAFHLAWLEGGNGENRGLRYASSSDGGRTWTAKRVLDDDTCACCWNTIAGSGDRLYTLYRDAVPRDMALMVSHNNGTSWERSGTVGSFDWQIDACPHNGGGLITARGAGATPVLHSVVWTGKENRVGVYYQSSKDEGRTWTSPRRMGDDGAKHSDLAVSSDGTLALVWDSYSKGQNFVFGSISKDGGKTWSDPQEFAQGGKLATHPRVASTKDGFRVFWTETPDTNVGLWKTAKLRAAAKAS